ncbi:MAG: polymer-forming cytoskeletal protein [Deltaproteobacteria bacterium]|nr:polymer-forming cytoskeletal protein [Deltaproteobacteria bacterium]
MAEAPTRISENQRVEGTLRASEDVSLAGSLRGRLECDRVFTVEASGLLEAECFVRSLVVHGVVIGDVHASEELVIERTGQVQGNIRARRLKLRAGGRIAGQVATGVEVRLPTPRETATAPGARRTPRAASSPASDDWDAAPPAKRSAPAAPQRPAAEVDVDELGAMPPGARAEPPRPEPRPAFEETASVAAPTQHEVETGPPDEVVETDEALQDHSAAEPLPN